MPKIHFIEHNGKEHVIDAEAGKTVMQAATENLVPGIAAEQPADAPETVDA